LDTVKVNTDRPCRPATLSRTPDIGAIRPLLPQFVSRPPVSQPHASRPLARSHPSRRAPRNVLLSSVRLQMNALRDIRDRRSQSTIDITMCHTAGGLRRPCTPPHDPFHPASCAMNTVANRTRDQDLPMVSNMVRGTRPRVPTLPVQRSGDETFRGCRGSEKDVFFGLNKYSRNVH